MGPSKRQNPDNAAHEGSDKSASQHEAPNLPAEFWNQPEIEQACRERHFGYLLKSWRELQNPIIKQSEAAEMLGITQGQISRIERTSEPPSDLRKLVEWSITLHFPESMLWFPVHKANDTQVYTPNSAPSTIEPTGNCEDDVDRRDLLKGIGIGAALLGTANLQETFATEQAGYRKLGRESIEVMREWTQTFRRIDNCYGGGYNLKQIGQYIESEVKPLLRDLRGTAEIKSELFSAAAELYQLAGWMSYDVGRTDKGQQALSTALALCQEANNSAFGTEILAGMSHQSSFLSAPDDAIDRAIMARNGAKQTGIQKLRAESAVMAAHAYALKGDKKIALASLQEAEAAFARVRPDTSPPWLDYMDGPYLRAKFGHTLKELGETEEAERFAKASLEMSDGYDRGKMFNTALLASVLADQGRVEEAVTQGTTAVQMAQGMKSVRTNKYLSDVGQRLTRYSDHQEVKQFQKLLAGRQIATRSA